MSNQSLTTRIYFAKNPVFTGAEFARAFPGKGGRANQSLLDYHARKGNVLRIRNGLYASVPAGELANTFVVNPLLIASKLTEDSVISHHAALQLHGVAHSMSRVITFTTKNGDFKPFEFQNSVFKAVATRRALIEGNCEKMQVVKQELLGGSVLVTGAERTVVDCIDRLELAGGLEEVINSIEGFGTLDMTEIVRYVSALETGTIAAKVGFILEMCRFNTELDSPWVMDSLTARLTKRPTFLFRKERQGTLVKKWNIIVPDWVVDRNWEEQF